MAEEQQKLRLNGMISAESDAALFEALNGVDKHRRMGRLRQLALIGLMVERGAAPSVTVAPAAASPEAATPKRVVSSGPSKASVASFETPSSSSVTADRNEPVELPTRTSDDKPRFNRAMLDQIDTGIME
jgi:hypothetical protein